MGSFCPFCASLCWSFWTSLSIALMSCSPLSSWVIEYFDRSAFYANYDKCEFRKTQIAYLGHANMQCKGMERLRKSRPWWIGLIPHNIKEHELLKSSHEQWCLHRACNAQCWWTFCGRIPHFGWGCSNAKPVTHVTSVRKSGKLCSPMWNLPATTKYTKSCGFASTPPHSLTWTSSRSCQNTKGWISYLSWLTDSPNLRSLWASNTPS